MRDVPVMNRAFSAILLMSVLAVTGVAQVDIVVCIVFAPTTHASESFSL